jgi:GT2 family glycosyltransferase
MLVVEPKLSKSIDQYHSLTPTHVLEIELSQPLPILNAFDQEIQYQCALCLIRFHTQPLGTIQLQFQTDALLPEDYAPIIWNTCKEALLRHLQQDGLPLVDTLCVEGLPYYDVPRCIAEREQFLAEAPYVSIIVPTRERPERLAVCIDAMMELRYPHYEIIIVDNTPITQATADLVQKRYQHVPNMRYVREDRPGISHARNRGIQEASGKILAFTDDDVVVDTYWLAQLAKKFSDSESNEIACVTGCTLPLKLDTPAQLWFEDMSWIDNGEVNNKCIPRLFDKKVRHKQLYRGSLCGHGANMAVRADFLRSIGGFDVSLGTGTPTMGGEDLALFLHVTMHNKVLAYEPTALVYHLHRHAYDALRKQVRGYGVGFTAYLIHMLLCYPVLWIDLLTKVPYDILRILLKQNSQSKRSILPGQQEHRVKFKGVSKSTGYPRELVIIQLRGFFYGPIAYIKSRRLIARIPRS